MNAVNPLPQEEIAEDVDVLDEILADGVELFGADGLQEILADFAETGEVSEELYYLLSGEYLGEEADISEMAQTPAREAQGRKEKKAASLAFTKAGDDLRLALGATAKNGQDPFKVPQARAHTKAARNLASVLARHKKEKQSKRLYGKGGKIVAQRSKGK